MARIVVGHFLADGSGESKPTRPHQLGDVLSAVKDLDPAPGYLGMFAPGTLATAAGDDHCSSSGSLDHGEIFFLQSIVLFAKAKVIGVQPAALLRVAKNGEFDAGLLHQPGQRDRTRLAAGAISGAAGEEQCRCLIGPKFS